MSNNLLTLADIQKTELGVLEAFHAFCEKNRLRYYLSGGTLIGAIRHKGFIPWDDDIDLCMPRPDFVRFLDLVQNNTINSWYKVISDPEITGSPSLMRIYDSRTQVEFENIRMRSKIGCWIDIFALDGVPTCRFWRKLHYRRMRIIMDCVLCCVTKFGGERRSKAVTMLQYLITPFLPFIRMIGHKKWLRLGNDIANKYKYDDCEYVGVIAGSGLDNETLRKADMDPAVSVEFENEVFCTMRNYEVYLTNMYGDYMTPPPENKRKSRHKIEAYWVEAD